MSLPPGSSARDRWLDLADEARAKTRDALANGDRRMAGLWDEHERTLLRNAYGDVPFRDAVPPVGTSESGFDPSAVIPAAGIQVASADGTSASQIAADEPRLTDPITVIGNPNEVDQPQREHPKALSRTGASLAIIKKREKRELKSYPDPGQKPTIGYGHLITKDEEKAGTFKGGIDEATADRILAQDVAKAEAAVRRLVKVPVSQNEYDALVSYVFNIGEGNFAGSQLLGKLNAGDYEEVGKFFTQSFITANGKKLPGLIERRIDEQKLFQQR
jgi:lysozyme